MARAGIEPAELARRIGQLALEKRGEEVVLLDLRGLSAACDFFVIASALSPPHLAAIADHVADSLAGEGLRPWHIEGLKNRRWVLVDFVDVVVHLFLAETREYYRLENLWSEAPREDLAPLEGLPPPDEAGGEFEGESVRPDPVRPAGTPASHPPAGAEEES